MAQFRWAKIGLFLSKEDVYAPYYREVLEHAGVHFSKVEQIQPDSLSSVDVLLVCGKGTFESEEWKVIHYWLENGGSIVFSGSHWNATGFFNLSSEGIHASNDVLTKAPDRVWPETASEIRFLGGVVWKAIEADFAIKTNSGFGAVLRKQLSRGTAILFGPHVGQSVCQMQMGCSVEVDAVGPSDGSATLDDQNLRAEDGTNLSFEHDRRKASDQSSPYFATPHADYLKEMWLRTVFEAVEATGKLGVATWYWPNNAEAASTVTIECEKFEVDPVFRLQRMFSMYGIRAAWLVALPGFPQDVYRNIRSWNHEAGLLFLTDDNGGWQEDKLKIQHLALGRSSSAHNFVTLRPVDGKWKGWKKLYEYSDVAGARLSTSKGGRQPGTQGFLFGTSHPFYALKKDGTPFLTAELPYTTYAPGIVVDDATSDAIFETTVNTHGCHHAVFKAEWSVHEEATASLRRIVSHWKQHSLAYMLPEEIYQFEKTRRSLRLNFAEALESGNLQLIADQDIEGLTLLFVGKRPNLVFKSRPVDAIPVQRFGTQMWMISLSLTAKSQVDLQVDTVESIAA